LSATVPSLLQAPPATATAVRLPAGDVAYAELRDRVEAASSALASGGVGAESRVLIREEDDLSRLITQLAVQSLGAVATPVNPLTSGAELAFLVTQSDPAAVVADEGLDAELELSEGIGVWINAGAGELREYRRCSVATAPRDPSPGDIASLLYTSGSSSRPRGVLLSHASHAAMGIDLARLLGIGPEDRFLALSPFFHVGGWSTAVMPALAAGASLVLPGAFSASRFWGDVERWRPTLWTTGLAFLEMVAARGGEPPRELSFRHVISNLRPDTWQLARETLRLPIGTYYGLTENNGRGTFARSLPEYGAGLVGKVYGPEDGVRVTADGEALPAGEIGEVEFRGPCVMRGYFRDEEATAAALRPGGWLGTGDLGRLDDDGTLWFTGRIKNMIKRSGENVAAEEVEFHLLTHPGVLDVAVTAVPDRVREEEVKAIVVPVEGAELSASGLHEYCSQGMASFKVPRYFQFVTELPHTISGKPDVASVRQKFASAADSWDSLEPGGRA
jgi:acyl-CoA synthetase (AMP-forming)/AMP-acid ligase II